MIEPAAILHGKILIVDDQEANVALLEQMLRGAGYDAIASTQDPGKVFELHLVNRFDLILLDLQMPGLDGFQVMEQLKALEPGYLPVLVITAQPAHKLRALQAGAMDFVSKPFEIAEVLLRVRSLLQVRLLLQETRRLYQRVLAEQQVSQRLLVEALPRSFAERLAAHPEALASATPPGLVSESFAEVTLLFSDLVEFTRFAEGASAEVLVGVLDEISASLDGQGLHPDLDRERITGEAWLAAVGASDDLATHSLQVAGKALDLVAALDRFNAHGRYRLQVRVGLDRAPDSGAGPGPVTSLHGLS
jgi:adenylate cyclase